ncbi:MAG: hypothetical protein J3Q66DRAFT_67534 [Benniella sp.]|nr:MAG: hypothetical protein J3Q66DRAFT_67534 [Benniella sp.]
MKDFTPFSPFSSSSFPLAIPVQLDSSYEAPNTRRLSPINGAASAMKNFLRRRRGATLVITNNADTDKVKSNRSSYELPTPQPSMAFVIVGGHGVVPGTTTVIFESGHSQSTAAVTTPVSTSSTPAIHVSPSTMPSQTPANTHLSSLPAQSNGLLAVTAAVSAHRKLLYRASRCVSIDGLLLLNSEPIIDEEPRAMTITEIVNSHANGMNQTYISNSIPSNAHFPSNSADDSKEHRVSTNNLNSETSHLPEDTLQHQVDISALDLKEEYYEDEDEDEDEDPQDQLYENSLNLIADYLTRYSRNNNPTPHQLTTNVQDLQISLEEIENEIKVLKSQEITLPQHSSADDVVLVSDLSSPTQYYDAPQTRQALRSYVGGTEKEFDEMVEFGFPTDAFSHRQQRSQATQCRYSTLRVTLTPWHARADELDLYGQISEISGKHAQFKSMVNRFFSRAPSHGVSTSPSGPQIPSSSTSSSQRRERSYVAARACSDSSLISSTTSNAVESASANHLATQARCRPHSISRDPKATYRAPIHMIASAERDTSNFEMLMSRPSLPIHYASSYLSQPPRKRTHLAFSAALQDRYEEDYDLRRVPVAFNSPSESDLSSSDPDHHLDSDDAIESTSSLADSYNNGSYRSTKMENIHPATSAHHIGVHYHRSKGLNPSDSTLIGGPLKPLDSSQGRSYRDRESDEMAQLLQASPRRGLRYPLPQDYRQHQQQHHQQQQALGSHNNFQSHHHGSLPLSRMPASALPGSMRASLRPPTSNVSPVSPLHRSLTMVDPKERLSLDETRRDIPSRQSSKMFGFSLRDKKKRESKSDGPFTLPRIGSMGWRGRESSMGAIQISGPLLDVGIDEYREEQLQKKRLEQEQEKEAKLLKYRQQQEDIVKAMKACSFG